MTWREIELRRGAAEPAGRWRKPSPGVFAAVRGSGFLPRLLGWLMLLAGSGIVLEQLGLVDFGDQPAVVPDLPGVAIGLAVTCLGVVLCLGCAGGEVDRNAATATQWWGLGQWRLRSRIEALEVFRAVRVHPRLITQGSFPSFRWCVSLVEGPGDAGVDEFLLHHVTDEAQAKALAAALADVLGIPHEVVTEMTLPHELRRLRMERQRRVAVRK